MEPRMKWNKITLAAKIIAIAINSCDWVINCVFCCMEFMYYDIDIAITITVYLVKI